MVNDDFLLDGFDKVSFFGNRVNFGNFFIFDDFLDSLNDFIDWDNLLSDGIINNRLENFIDDILGFLFVDNSLKGFLKSDFHDDIFANRFDFLHDILSDIEFDLNLSLRLVIRFAGIVAGREAWHGHAAAVISSKSIEAGLSEKGHRVLLAGEVESLSRCGHHGSKSQLRFHFRSLDL